MSGKIFFTGFNNKKETAKNICKPDEKITMDISGVQNTL
jgi:hypothetical protein